MKHALVALLVLLPISGCVNVPDEATLAVPAEWFQCRWTYPDGSPLDCNGTTQILKAQRMEGHWLCMVRDETPHAKLLLLRSVTTGEAGIYFEVNSSVAPRGVVMIESNEEMDVYSWSGQGQRGFLPLGKAYAGPLVLGDLLYNSHVETNDPRLPDATVEQAWSYRDQKLWVVHHVQTGGNTYLFYNQTPLPFGGTSSAVSQFHSSNGYQMKIDMKYWLDGRFPVRVSGTIWANPSCSLEETLLPEAVS